MITSIVVSLDSALLGRLLRTADRLCCRGGDVCRPEDEEDDDDTDDETLSSISNDSSVSYCRSWSWFVLISMFKAGEAASSLSWRPPSSHSSAKTALVRPGRADNPLGDEWATARIESCEEASHGWECDVLPDCRCAASQGSSSAAGSLLVVLAPRDLLSTTPSGTGMRWTSNRCATYSAIDS